MYLHCGSMNCADDIRLRPGEIYVIIKKKRGLKPNVEAPGLKSAGKTRKQIKERLMEKMTMSTEDYLETIYVLGRDGLVKSTDVAAVLSVSRPAVNKAMGELVAKGLVDKHSYGKIRLTNEGFAAAEKVYARHRLLHDFLVSIGVSEQTAAVDCCKIEHFISEETVEKLSRFMEKANR
mgnify:FL=1